jgi:hypothetical protein
VSLQGACHCGRIQVRFETAKAPLEIEVRACQCGFCRRHNGKTVSDPQGRVVFRAAPRDLTRYRFGTRSADFLICGACGTYLGAVTAIEGALYGIVNAAGAAIPEFDSRTGEPRDYADETVEAKSGRRKRLWSPARVIEA